MLFKDVFGSLFEQCNFKWGKGLSKSLKYAVNTNLSQDSNWKFSLESRNFRQSFSAV